MRCSGARGASGRPHLVRGSRPRTLRAGTRRSLQATSRLRVASPGRSAGIPARHLGTKARWAGGREPTRVPTSRIHGGPRPAGPARREPGGERQEGPKAEGTGLRGRRGKGRRGPAGRRVSPVVLPTRGRAGSGGARWPGDRLTSAADNGGRSPGAVQGAPRGLLGVVVRSRELPPGPETPPRPSTRADPSRPRPRDPRLAGLWSGGSWWPHSTEGIRRSPSAFCVPGAGPRDPYCLEDG